MTVASLALLLFSVAAAACGQLLLKHGMQVAVARSAATRGSLTLAAATSPWVLLGLVVFAVSATTWLVVLARVPLSVAYPFNALGYLAILTVSVVVLHERASIWTWVGTLMVVSGLIIVVLTRRLRDGRAHRHGVNCPAPAFPGAGAWAGLDVDGASRTGSHLNGCRHQGQRQCRCRGGECI
jgi:drug/metabolite transporter (DMT)-like permease